MRGTLHGTLPLTTLLALDSTVLNRLGSGSNTYPASESHAAHSIYFEVLGDHGFVGQLASFYLAISHDGMA